MEELNDIIERLEELEGDVKVVILRSNFSEFFSAGGDISEWYSYTKIQAYREGIKGAKILERLENLPVPTIAAVSGSCLGGGCELALSCDFRIASESALFGQPEILLGNGPS